MMEEAEALLDRVLPLFSAQHPTLTILARLPIAVSTSLFSEAQTQCLDVDNVEDR